MTQGMDDYMLIAQRNPTSWPRHAVSVS